MPGPQRGARDVPRGRPTLSHYRLIEKIGEGGMGVVWKALDTRLDREVAIKFLPEAFTADPERLARFEREAKLLASLEPPQHRHGLRSAPSKHDGVHGFHRDGTRARRRPGRHALRAAPLPLDEALELARQVADALEAAHERGVIHRDLKPANITVSRRTARSRCSTSAWPSRWPEPAAGRRSVDADRDLRAERRPA